MGFSPFVAVGMKGNSVSAGVAYAPCTTAREDTAHHRERASAIYEGGAWE